MRKHTDVPCTKCGARVGVMCRSLKDNSWPVEHVHAPRLRASQRQAALKKAFRSLREEAATTGQI